MNRKTQLLIGGVGAAAAFYAVWRVVGGKHIKTLPFGYGIKIKKAITVNCPADQLYKYWRNVSNLQRLSGDVLSIKPLDATRSHWTLRAAGGINLEWDAEITVDRHGEMIGWRSLDGADMDSAGYVRFEQAAGCRGTVVRVALQYNPPAGKIGAAVSSLFGEKPANQIEEALRKFKQLMECGEVATALNEKELPHSAESVDIASEDSFPASDPPAWTGTTGPAI